MLSTNVRPLARAVRKGPFEAVTIMSGGNAKVEPLSSGLRALEWAGGEE
jgi:hypothetical protein